MCTTAALSGFVALQILFCSTNKWFADPQITCIVDVHLPQTLCWQLIQSKDPKTLGCGLQKGQRKRAWFSEPPNKELGGRGAYSQFAHLLAALFARPVVRRLSRLCTPSRRRRRASAAVRLDGVCVICSTRLTSTRFYILTPANRQSPNLTNQSRSTRHEP